MSSLSKASRAGRLEGLSALRDRLCDAIESDEVSPRDLAPLASRLQSVLEQIDELAPKSKGGDVVDEITQRRAARRAGPTAGPGRSQRSG